MLLRVAISVALIGAVAAGVQTYRLDDLRQQVAISGVQLETCGARLQNLIEDLESDNEIDRLPDSALTDVPDEWMRPEGTD
jgi:hypothetical protein